MTTTPATPTTPAEAWAALQEGNSRFVGGQADHPNQNVERRAELSAAQAPFAVLFGCSDSRVAAEIIFDRGLGDLFVVRTAGHVVDTTVIGSIEFGVDLLHTPLVVVLGHHGCGAVGAAAEALASGSLPNNFVRAIVDRVIPSLVTGTAERDGADGSVNKDSLTLHLVDQRHLLTEHVRSTVHMLHDYSAVLEEAVAQGRCAIVGMEYDLADGTARTVEVIGDVGPR